MISCPRHEGEMAPARGDTCDVGVKTHRDLRERLPDAARTGWSTLSSGARNCQMKTPHMARNTKAKSSHLSAVKRSMVSSLGVHQVVRLADPLQPTPKRLQQFSPYSAEPSAARSVSQRARNSSTATTRPTTALRGCVEGLRPARALPVPLWAEALERGEKAAHPPFDAGELGDAWRAPRCPEVQEQRPIAERARLDDLVVHRP